MNEELEFKLQKHIRKNRLIWGGIFLIGILVAIVFAVLYEDSRQVEIIGVQGSFLSYEKVTYNTDLGFGVFAGMLIAMFGCSLFAGAPCSRYESTRGGGDVVTVYRGMSHSILSINGVEKAHIAPLDLSYYLEEFESLDHFKKELVDYIDYYNNRRIKARLKGLPPALHRQQALLAA